jgi:hypothetical protein
MNEAFLHYVWQCQYFDKTELLSVAGESISVIKVGNHNTDQGPDFSNAKIKIGNIEWIGHVEIHLRSSDWNQHAHQHNPAYDNVVLHVVWKHDTDVRRMDGSLIATLELCNRVDGNLPKSYHQLINSASSIPCKNAFPAISELTKLSMIEKAMTHRLKIKSALVLEMLEKNKGDWEETFYQILCKNFGFKVNADPFFQLSKVVPFRLVQKQRSSLLQLEALLFGGAGMLMAKSNDEYIVELYREYQLLARKYSLSEHQLHYTQWKFLRLRPANFPTLRIAQLAALLFSQTNIFSRVLEIEDLTELKSLFKTQTSSYWHTHYRFGKKSTKGVYPMGEDSIENVVVNSIVPVLSAYSQARDDQRMMDKAVRWLEQLPAEKNKIIRVWSDLGLQVKHSFDSQALIEQFNNMCQKRNCLQCVIGASLVKPINT